MTHLSFGAVPCGLALFLLAASAPAQYAERAALFGDGAASLDVSGRSVKNPRVRAIHARDPSLEGTTAYFFAKDPFLAYQLGRNLNFREFREREGTFKVGAISNLESIGQLSGPMPDDTTAKITANNQTSCTSCHNQPYGNPGGGISFSKDSGFGRQSPHYFGTGLVEMLAIQVREEIMAQLDADGSGWVSAAEAAAAPDPVLVEPVPGAPKIDFGSPKLDPATMRPQLNNHIKVFYVDGNGKWVSDALGVDGVTTQGYNLQLQVFGWGQGVERQIVSEETGFEFLRFGGAVNPTNRAFLWDPWLTHGGIDAHDPSTLDDPDGDGVSRPTLAGAIQFPATHRPPDTGPEITPDPLVGGYSGSDPDNDKYWTEISEGDLDLAEWFMLNLPAPAFRGTQAEYDEGLALMDAMGCTACHVPDWLIKPATRRKPVEAEGALAGGGGQTVTPQTTGPVYAGDRRFFDFPVTWNETTQRLEGELVPLYELKRDGTHELRREGFLVEGLFSDLAQHDMGEGFTELAFDASLQTLWRTAPLWGVGSGFPWGHDGASMTLDHVIRRHDGEGAASKSAYLAASAQDRKDLVRFLRKLVLYDIETLPADIDGDGTISSNFVVQGVDTGVERFNAEWLFGTPVQIQGPVVNADGEAVLSNAAVNLEAAYGMDLPYRKDTDLDGWPDVWDSAPTRVGYKNGAN